ncbi:MAG TPA: hypothetical protein VJ521_01335, partial [Acidobacteriota bacterium]|nr:hypothetical protein [Acidobacteriota bacterium]
VNTPITLRLQLKGSDETTFIGWQSVTNSAIPCAGSPGDCNLILVQDSRAHASFGLSSDELQVESNDPIVVDAVQEPEVIANIRGGNCCFRNANYAGICTVTIAARETCTSMLEYLNTPGTSGKTYCSQTQLRGGWQEIDCP